MLTEGKQNSPLRGTHHRPGSNDDVWKSVCLSPGSLTCICGVYCVSIYHVSVALSFLYLHLFTYVLPVSFACVSVHLSVWIPVRLLAVCLLPMCLLLVSLLPVCLLPVCLLTCLSLTCLSLTCVSAHLCVQERANGLEPPPQDKVQALRSQVDGVKDIMTQNVDRILARGERLDDLMGKSEDLQAGVSVTTLLVNKVLRNCFFCTNNASTTMSISYFIET